MKIKPSSSSLAVQSASGRFLQQLCSSLIVSCALAGTVSASDESQDNNHFSYGEKGIQFQQGDFKLNLGALLQYDWYNARDDQTHIPANGHDWRDQRLFISGSFGKDWNFKYSYDFKSISHKDAWLQFAPWQLTLGQFKSPVGLENQHSSRYWTFNEPAMLTTLAPQRFAGIMWQPIVGDGTFTAAIQKANINDEVSYSSQPLRTSTRLTWAPVQESTETLHLGGSLQWVNFEDDRRTVKLAVHPEAKNEDIPKLISTGKIKAESQQVGGLESGYVNGPLALRGEYLTTRLKDQNLSNTYYFQSAYLQASYFLDGETYITYNPAKGVFGKPSNVNQRWEVAARSSWTDLEDSNVKGGKETNYTLGLSFYYNLNLRFTLNYIHGDVEDGRKGDEKINLVTFRTQLAF
ncbi:MAG: OprO/OprP family phosphate-selective porin [Endozoicomonas sp.]|uniref:OprO/OprP family phosphate-selective porin n=1 Tax=Endozoicomonas sp. TaxID=1892382 RepID=UPI003D9B9818